MFRECFDLCRVVGCKSPASRLELWRGFIGVIDNYFIYLLELFLFGWLSSVLGTVAIHSFSAIIDMINDLGIIFFDVISERIIYPSLGR